MLNTKYLPIQDLLQTEKLKGLTINFIRVKNRTFKYEKRARLNYTKTVSLTAKRGQYIRRPTHVFQIDVFWTLRRDSIYVLR